MSTFLQPFVEDEDVLVESANGRILWDAVIVDVCKEQGSDNVSGYLVHYKNWSSRFDQWVPPGRVVEPSENNLLVQVSYFSDVSYFLYSSHGISKFCSSVVFLIYRRRSSRNLVSTNTQHPPC